ncbi:exo-alpha-sialidase [bacterium]|nr:exo-alpha-sialidase [bacterium]
MANRSAVLGVTALTVLCLGGVDRAVAMKITASGSYNDRLGHGDGRWSGALTVDGARVTGAIDLDGAVTLKQVPVTGFRNGRGIDLAVTDGTGATRAFAGRLDDTGIEGEFQLGEIAGTWKGTWTIAPGEPLALAPLEPLAPVRQRSLEKPLPPADPYDVCAVLDDPEATAQLSPGREAAMRRECDGWQEAQASLIQRVTWQVAQSLRPLWRWAGDRLIFARSAWASVTNVRVNDSSLESYPNITQGSPSVAAKRSQNATLLSVFEDFTFGSTRRIAYSVSYNSGVSWDAQQAFIPPSPPTSIDGEPLTVSDSEGSLYVVYLATQTGQPGGRIDATCSLGGGSPNAWKTAADASLGGQPGAIRDKPNVAVDANNVYVCYTEKFGAYQTIRLASAPKCSSAGSPLVFSNPNVDVLDGDYANAGPATNCSIAIGPAGDLYVGWWNPDYSKMFVRRSTNGGATWATSVALTPGNYARKPVNVCNGNNARPVLNQKVYSEPRLNLAADPLVTGRLYAAWGHAPVDTSDVYFTRSDNHGANWTFPPGVLNTATAGDQFLPALVSFVYLPSTPHVPEIDAVWYDRRLDPGNVSYDVYRRASFDGGVTWQTEERLTSQTLLLPQLSPHFDSQAQAAGRECVLTNRAGLADNNPSGAFTYPVWTDTRIVSQPQPDPDIEIGTPPGGGC